MRSPAALARADRLDIVCAGQATWVAEGARRRASGPIAAAAALARAGLRVGLATVLPDDEHGRDAHGHLARAGIDVGGVAFASARRRVVLAEHASFAEEARPIEVPERWSARVLLISGVAPVLERRDVGERASDDRDASALDAGGMAHAAALCRAARGARRGGASVVLDLNVRWQLWRGRDPGAIAMVVREADVVWCSAEDLLGLGISASTVHAWMRADSVLLVHEGAGRVRATARFGEIAIDVPPGHPRALLDDDAMMSSLCADLARTGIHGEAGWHAALSRAHRAAIRAPA